LGAILNKHKNYNIMKTRSVKTGHGQSAFTIIEVMIVLAIAGLIMVLVFIAVPQAAASRRDSERKAYAQQVYQAMEEYYKNNGHFLHTTEGSDWPRFMVEYMPAGTDPSTGKSFGMDSVDDIDWVSHGQTNPQRSLVILDSGVPHIEAKPQVGQVIIATGHICQSAHPDGGDVLSDIAYFKQHIEDTFAIIVYQEHGEYFCIDNYDDNTPLPP
jgi:prepilin-type N-terminal cleavage/methylation domain-containing protein